MIRVLRIVHLKIHICVNLIFFYIYISTRKVVVYLQDPIGNKPLNWLSNIRSGISICKYNFLKCINFYVDPSKFIYLYLMRTISAI